MTGDRAGRTGTWPVHGWIGLVRITLFWTLNWSLSGLRIQRNVDQHPIANPCAFW
jgi:hypothetical protein